MGTAFSTSAARDESDDVEEIAIDNCSNELLRGGGDLTEEELREGLRAEREHEARRDAIQTLMSHSMSVSQVTIVLHSLRILGLSDTLRNCYEVMPHLSVLSNGSDVDTSSDIDEGPPSMSLNVLLKQTSGWLLALARSNVRVQILPLVEYPLNAPSLSERMSVIRSQLRMSSGTIPSELDFDKSDPVSSALEAIMSLSRTQLRKPLCVRFNGLDSVAADYGGVAREFLACTADGIMTGLLPHIAFAGRKGEGFPDANSTATLADGIVFYRGLGRLCGLCLRHPDWILPLNLSPALFRVVCGLPITSDDLPTIDSELDDQLKGLAALPLHQVEALQLVFAVERTVPDADGSTQAEFLRGGSDVHVTGFNVYNYYLSRLFWRLGGGFRSLLIAFARGFHDAVPLNVIQGVLTPEELLLAVCGERELPSSLLSDVEFVQDPFNTAAANHRLEASYRWCIGKLTQEELQGLCRFATGVQRAPITGFPTRSGKLRVAFVAQLSDAHRPVAHTCSYQIDMPPYSDAVIMLARLKEAIGTTGFHIL